jgi:divalent metal cation (Fe/Co/Zn/Cd) transporter
VLKIIPGVLEVEEIQAHRFGPYFVLNITVCIDGALTVSQGDAIASEVEGALCARIDGIQRAYVHYHPVSKTSAGA